jgi:hypothetical protein
MGWGVLAYVFTLPCGSGRYFGPASRFVNTLSLPVRASIAATRPDGRLASGALTLGVVALLIVAVWLRACQLENVPGVNGDEAWSGVQALRFLQGETIDWRTPTGNPVNVFFLIPLMALHLFLPPSFIVLRFVSLASGVLALVVNYFLCRRAFDRQTAVVSTLLLALLPIDIAYSRFAWDASQSLLATLFVLYLPLIHLRRHGDSAWLSTPGMVALGAAIVVHPTNVFAAPLLVVPALYARRRPIVAALQNTAIPAKTTTLAVLVAVSAAAAYGAWRGLAIVAPRLHGSSDLAGFAQNYLRLFSGTTVYEFISGTQAGAPHAAWFVDLPRMGDALFGLLAIGCLWGMVLRLKHDPADSDQSLVLGWFFMLVAFFIVAGPGAIAPHVERYGMCLIAPGALLLSRGLAWWIEQRRPRHASVALGLALVAWLWPLSFYWGYFEFIQQTGGRSHVTFRTAAVEPKLEAFRYVLNHRHPNEATEIVCHEWWNYWPLAYLARGEDNVQVLTWDQWREADRVMAPGPAGKTWFIEYAGTTSEHEVVQRWEQDGLTIPRQTICDYGHHELLSILGPAENNSENY